MFSRFLPSFASPGAPTPADGPPATTAAADTIVPLHYFDDTLVFRSFLIYTLFAFDAVLDPAVLRDGLERLVRRDGWRKLGGRLRKNVS